MADLIETYCRLRAYEAGRAQVQVSHRQVSIRPHAMVLCPIAMAGQDSTIHILATGRLGAPADLLWVPDARFRDDQYTLFLQLGERLEEYYAECRGSNSFPQIWVSSNAAAKQLDLIADRLRYTNDDPRLRRVGDLLTYPCQRHAFAGQQTLICATSALATHWATGQQPGEDEHLATILTWIMPPPGQNLQSVIAQRERWPMAINTDPRFDRITLQPLVAAYNGARKAAVAPTELARRSAQVRDALTPTVSRIYNATQRAIQLLRSLPLPTLPGLAAMEVREAEEFASFMASRDAGYPIALRDKPKAAAFGISAREEADGNVRAAVVIGDRVARAKARLNGTVLRGMVVNPVRVRTGSRRFENRFEIVSDQPALRLRTRDELTLIDDPRLKVTIERIERDGATVRIVVRIVRGERAVGLPTAGDVLEFSDRVPEWSELIRLRRHLRVRLADTPWTHLPDAMPGSFGVAPPEDPLADVEAMR